MTDRDQLDALADIIGSFAYQGGVRELAWEIAEKIIAAGWRPPRPYNLGLVVTDERWHQIADRLFVRYASNTEVALTDMPGTPGGYSGQFRIIYGPEDIADLLRENGDER